MRLKTTFLLLVVVSAVTVAEGVSQYWLYRRALSDLRSYRIVTKKLTVSNGNDWGDWGYVDFCAKGTYAVGYEMKIERPQGFGDDSALNGIKLKCLSPNGGFPGSATSEIGPWGTWRGQELCESRRGKQHFLKSFSLQVEKEAFDQTSANFVKFRCRDFDNTVPYYEMAKYPGHGEWGTYGYWSSECDSGEAICGIQTKIEKPVGDNSALNDVRFMCCP